MVDDWLYVERQRIAGRWSKADGADAPIAYLDFYVWQCRYCGAREATVKPEPPHFICKCMKKNSSVKKMSDYERGEWDMFLVITSAWHGKQYYFRESDGRVWSRESGKYMSVDEAYKEFIDSITAY